MAIEVMFEVTEVVACLHNAGVVHRDIKPRNIAFNRAGDLKLPDFGLARLEREAAMSGVGGHVVVGTPAYLLPEAPNHRRTNPGFDLWSLGVSFYEVLVGQLPFAADSHEGLVDAMRTGNWASIAQHMPACPRHLRDYFSVALAQNSSDRPRSAQHIVRRPAALRNAPC